MTTVGYARTSTADQETGLADQIQALGAAGAERVYQERVSAVDADRPELAKALDYVREGDVFMVTRPDRLARSTGDLLGIVDRLTSRGIRVRVLSIGGGAGGLDTGDATSKLMLTILGAVAEFERSLMKERQRAGIEKAKAEGKYKGRKPTARAQADEVLRRLEAGESQRSVASALGIGKGSVDRIIKSRTTKPIK
jgi:DNA invertase Pin-like site-specific DNA recombinase